MATRMHKQKRRRKKCGKIEIHGDEPVFSCSDKFLIRENSDCIQKSEDTHSYGDEKKFKIRRSVEFSSATARCILWRIHGHSHGETCRCKKKKNQEMWTLPNLKLGSEEDVTGKPVADKTAAGNPTQPVNQTAREVQELKRYDGPHNLHVSPATVHHSGAVFLDRQGGLRTRTMTTLCMIWT